MLKNYITNSKIADNKNIRYEKKFSCNEEQYNTFLSWLYNYTDLRKKFSKRNVKSIYFDTDNFDSAKDNIAGISIRQKYRLRWYNDDLNSIFLEIKKRNNFYNKKERVRINLKKKNIFEYSSSELLNEILQHSNVLKINNLKPIIIISYDREYYENIDGIRLTIDKNLKFSRIFGSDSLKNLFHTNYTKYILELKFGISNSSQVINFLKKAKFVNTRNSKYMLGLNSFGIVYNY